MAFERELRPLVRETDLHIEQVLLTPLAHIGTRRCAIGAFLAEIISGFPFVLARDSSIMRASKIDIADAGGRSGLWQQTASVHSRNSVDLQHKRLAAVDKMTSTRP